jgi:hypothetical protein
LYQVPETHKSPAFFCPASRQTGNEQGNDNILDKNEVFFRLGDPGVLLGGSGICWKGPKKIFQVERPAGALALRQGKLSGLEA